MQISTSLQTGNHASTPPLSFLQAYALPAAQPTASKHWRHWRKGIQPEKLTGGVLAWLSAARCTCIRPSWCHCHSLSLASVKSRLVSPFWYWLTQVVSEKGPLNGCVCVCFQGNFHRYHSRVLPLALKCNLFVTAKILVRLKDRFRMNIRAFSCILGILKTHYSHIIGA